jgi:radical SAM superfamily enzyme YgiQ (UPF0313 family)
MGAYVIHLVNIVPLTEGINLNDIRHVPYGILYVGSYLKRHGFEVKLHHITPTQIESAVQEICRDGPLYVGFSVLTGLTTFYSSYMSKLIKQTNPHIKIIWGGHHPSLLPMQCLKEPYIDYVCIGEGEVTGLEFTKALREGRDLSEIESLGFKEDMKNLMINKRRPLSMNLDEFDIDWSLLKFKNYFPKVGEWYSLDIDKRKKVGNKHFITLFSSRGCRFNCKFCSTRKFSGRSWRCHSENYIFRQINKLEERGLEVGMVAFSDDNFFINVRRGLSIIRQLHGMGIYTDYINVRFNQINKKLLDEFDRYEVHSTFVGFESGSNRLLTLMNKQITAQEIIEKTRLLSLLPKMTTVASGIIGIPTQTKDEYVADIHFALNLNEIIQNGIVSLFRFMPLPKTELTALAIRDGFVPPAVTEDWRITDPQYSGYKMNWLPWVNAKTVRQMYYAQTIFRNYLPKVPVGKQIKGKFISLILEINRARIRNNIYFSFDLQIHLLNFLVNSYRGIKSIIKRLKYG